MDTAPALRAPACEATRGELVDDGALAQLAAEVARQQAAPLTRTTYAGVYRAFCAFLGPDAGPDAVTAASVRAYRDRLEQEGRSPATIAKQLSALRALAAALGVDGVREARGAKVARGEPRALTPRTTHGCCGCPTCARSPASATWRCCTCSAPPASGAPRPARC